MQLMSKLQSRRACCHVEVDVESVEQEDGANSHVEVVDVETESAEQEEDGMLKLKVQYRRDGVKLHRRIEDSVLKLLMMWMSKMKVQSMRIVKFMNYTIS